jgi:hypothetical protein
MGDYDQVSKRDRLGLTSDLTTTRATGNDNFEHFIAQCWKGNNAKVNGTRATGQFGFSIMQHLSGGVNYKYELHAEISYYPLVTIASRHANRPGSVGTVPKMYPYWVIPGTQNAPEFENKATGQFAAFAPLYASHLSASVACTVRNEPSQARRKILSPLPVIEPRSPGHPARSQTLCWLSYPAHFYSLRPL